jgi:ADP-heptose:LPS heptosyltransferase
MRMKHILIIKHGALGDLILATGPMKAIRAAHPQAHITLLTQPGFAGLMKDCPFIDEIWTDSRPKLWQLNKSLPLLKQLRSRPFEWVYDLQTSSRSSLYHRFIRHTNWSGIAKGASHRHDTPHRTRSHTIDRQREQLAIAGITDVPLPDTSWMRGDLSPLHLPERFCLLVPGGSAHRPEKRWPAEHFIALAGELLTRHITPVLLGSQAEAEILDQIAHSDDRILHLGDKTNLPQIAALAVKAACAVGNDTGPMHLIAASGCPRCVVMFNTLASDPALCAPRGENVIILTAEGLEKLAVEKITKLLPV